MRKWIAELFSGSKPSEVRPYPSFEAVADDDAYLASLVGSGACEWVAEEDIGRFLSNGYAFYLDSSSSTGRVQTNARDPGSRTFAVFLMTVPRAMAR
jgi:hypothetical protein